MKIADALLLQKDISEEINRLRSMAKAEGWEYRSTDPNAKWVQTFDLEENHKRVKTLMRLQRKISRSISIANNTLEVPGLNDQDFSEWL
jgi:hypothetical protein